ncbi:hypothetical protein ACQU0X_02665 [Pseudovibrio ascidiaceicola]|uniref:hypothetical protein n=1 Tax=Pseudovibrio ascidiaceicola TaxID=285279 RepID=UPI003D366E6B
MQNNSIKALIPAHFKAMQEQDQTEAREAFAYVLETLGISKFDYILSQYQSAQHILKAFINKPQEMQLSASFTSLAGNLTAMDRDFKAGKLDEAMQFARLIQLATGYYVIDGDEAHMIPKRLQLPKTASKPAEIIDLLPEVVVYDDEGSVRSYFDDMGKAKFKKVISNIFKAADAWSFSYELERLSIAEYAFLNAALEWSSNLSGKMTVDKLSDDELTVIYQVERILQIKEQRPLNESEQPRYLSRMIHV